MCYEKQKSNLDLDMKQKSVMAEDFRTLFIVTYLINDYACEDTLVEDIVNGFQQVAFK